MLNRTVPHHKEVEEYHHHAADEHGKDGQDQDAVGLQNGVGHQHQAYEDVGHPQDGQDGSGDGGVQLREQQPDDGLAQNHHPHP